ADDAADDAFGVSGVLSAVRRVELVVDVLRLDEEHVLVDTAGFDVGFVARLCAAEPGGRASIDGADVEVVIAADDPHRHRLAQRAVTSHGREIQLFSGSDLAELVTRPRAHSASPIRDPRVLSGRSAVPAVLDTGH